MPRHNASPGKSEAAAERRERAFRLRKLGMGYRTIGDKLGVSSTQAFRDVTEVLKDLAKKTERAAKQLRQMEGERLDLLWRRLLPKVRTGDPKAIAAAVRVVARRCSLFGLDEPRCHEHTGKDGAPIHFKESIEGVSLDDFKKLPTTDKVALLRGAMGMPEKEEAE